MDNGEDTSCKTTRGFEKYIDAVHLLANVNAKYVKSYINDFTHRYSVRKSNLKFQCLLCKSSLISSWKEFMNHINTTRHIKEIKTGSKQYTLVCLFCKHVLIAEDRNIIFDHFSSHSEEKKSCHPTSSVDLSSTETFLLSDNNEVSKGHFEASKTKFDIGEPLNDDGSIMVSNSLFNNGNSVGIKNKTEIKGEKLGDHCQFTIEQQMLKTKILKKPSIGREKFINRSPNQNIHLNISRPKDAKNKCNEKIPIDNVSLNKHFHKQPSCEASKISHPQLAKFSESGFQLVSPGLLDDFTILQNLNVSNIDKYVDETYYSMYHVLRKLYYSCLKCNSRCLEKELFYSHLKEEKHFLKDKRNMIAEGDSTDNFVKICDICQLFLLGSIGDIDDHFNSTSHNRTSRLRMDLIKEQYILNSGRLKLGWSGELSAKSVDMFSSKDNLNYLIELSLEEAAQTAAAGVELNKSLQENIRKALHHKCSDLDFEFIGSRRYGLAKRCSDVDIHLNTGEVTIQEVEKCLSMADHLFKIKRTIYDAKVPIIRLEYIPTGLICDINTSNFTGGLSSELIKTYISLDPRVLWVVMACREWAAANDILGSQKFTSYGFTWLVLFFLMLPRISLVPPVKVLKSLYHGTRQCFKGWDHSFTRDIDKIKEVHNPALCCFNKYELLRLFFEFCSTLNSKKKVLFTHNGHMYPRHMFANPNIVDLCPPELHANWEDPEPVRVGGQFMLMDSCRLRENLIRIDENLADHFKSICAKTLECGCWS